MTEEQEFRELIDRYSARLMNADLTKGEIKILLCQFAREHFGFVDRIRSRISNEIADILDHGKHRG